VSESECVCVSEEGGREGGGGGRGADTELKTKTPHVNVGKKAAGLASGTLTASLGPAFPSVSPLPVAWWTDCICTKKTRQ